MRSKNRSMLVVLIAAATGVGGGSLTAYAQGEPDRPSPPVKAEPPGGVGSWRAGGSMHVTREYPGGIVLGNGKVLAVSGHPLQGKSIETAELYDPATDAWELTGSLQQARNGGNGATLLADGRVLLAGDHDNASGRALRGTEVYDPNSGKWTETGSLHTARGVHTTTLLADGRVLAAGGIDWGTERVFASAEVFDPATGTWRETGSMAGPRFAHGAVALVDGRVLVIGGWDGYPGKFLSTAELYDPKTGHWSAAQRMDEVRRSFGVARLLDGRVLVVGGLTRIGESKVDRYLSTAIVYEPGKNVWRAVGSMATRRASIVATVLQDGRVLVAGGRTDGGRELSSAEIYDPETGKWRGAGSMGRARRNHRAALLDDGRVLVIGGSTAFGGVYLKSTDIFTPGSP